MTEETTEAPKEEEKPKVIEVVTRYQAVCGGLYKTKEEAEAADRAYEIRKEVSKLVEGWKSKIGSKNYTDNTISFIVAHQAELKEILK